MAVVHAPIFTQASALAWAQASTAVTVRTDGAANVVDLVTGGSNGTLIDFLSFTATVTTAAGSIGLWYKPSGGSYHFIEDILTAAVTPSTTVAAAKVYWTPNKPFILNNGDKLGFAPRNSETWNGLAYGSNY